MKMSVAEVQEAYIKLQQAVLTQEAWALMQKDKSDAHLNQFINELGQLTGINIDEPFYHENCGTKCAACTINPNGATHHVWLRSYLVRDRSSPSSTIRQAIIASLADLDHLSSLTLGSPLPQSFASACHRGFSNPTAIGLKELNNAFRNSNKRVATVVNIGIGHPGPLTLSHAGPSSHELLRICIDSERVSEEIERLSTGLAGFFFRFSVAQGLQAFAGCDHPTQEVHGHAMQYYLSESTSQKLDRAVAALTRRTAVVSCERLSVSFFYSPSFV
ncbi:hypothetical protein DL96DRAFT_1584661 [Flagelloscypha sp. PMI_526]|nr:hypothetical protein DL96DRAFT_1584661 [Flagelloscypha sp. PMI_526]